MFNQRPRDVQSARTRQLAWVVMFPNYNNPAEFSKGLIWAFKNFLVLQSKLLPLLA